MENLYNLRLTPSSAHFVSFSSFGVNFIDTIQELLNDIAFLKNSSIDSVDILGLVGGPASKGNKHKANTWSQLACPSGQLRCTQQNIPASQLWNGCSVPSFLGISRQYMKIAYGVNNPSNHFSSGWKTIPIVRGNVNIVNFTNACKTHDRCFAGQCYGSNVQAAKTAHAGCNRNFTRHLNASCNGLIRDDLRKCKALAKLYSRAVSKHSNGAFIRSQLNVACTGCQCSCP